MRAGGRAVGGNGNSFYRPAKVSYCTSGDGWELGCTSQNTAAAEFAMVSSRFDGAMEMWRVVDGARRGIWGNGNGANKKTGNPGTDGMDDTRTGWSWLLAHVHTDLPSLPLLDGQICLLGVRSSE